MKLKREVLYTQSTNECAPYTIFNIWRTKFGIILNEEQRQRFLNEAKKDGVWSAETGAYFNIIFNWATGWFKKEFGQNITVETIDILSDAFEQKALKRERFGIGLMYASNWFRTVRADKEITIKEVDAFDKDKNKKYGHAQIWTMDTLIGILKSIPYGDKLISFKLEALRQAVRKGIYYATARTFSLENERLQYYLIELNKGTVFQGVEAMEEKEKVVLELAIKLRTYTK